jgi:hypothetical protein
VLIVDELGYLPIDKHGADLLFQIISQRYERAPMVITTDRATNLVLLPLPSTISSLVQTVSRPGSPCSHGAEIRYRFSLPS